MFAATIVNTAKPRKISMLASRAWAPPAAGVMAPWRGLVRRMENNTLDGPAALVIQRVYAGEQFFCRSRSRFDRVGHIAPIRESRCRFRVQFGAHVTAARSGSSCLRRAKTGSESETRMTARLDPHALAPEFIQA